MPAIYLSPFVQESEQYIIGGGDEYYTNRIVDAMIPHLNVSGILFTRSEPGSTITQVIKRSNAAHYNLHLILRSGISPDNLRGILQGPDIYFYSGSPEGQRAAEIFSEHLKKIYPSPQLVTKIPTTIPAELRLTDAPAVLAEIAYRDNYSDAAWVRDNIDLIAENLAESVTEYLGS